MKRSSYIVGAVLWSVAVCGVPSCTIFDGLEAKLTPLPPDTMLKGNPNGLDTGGPCARGNDCKSGVCTGNLCAAPTSTDNVLNGDESDVDCGGSGPKCGVNRTCRAPTDCASSSCAGDKCAAATFSDNIKNGDETDVDCGGPTAPKRCETDKFCAAPTDCKDQVCTARKCAAPTATDAVKNGDESDVDCGGTITGAPRCGAGLGCNNEKDCASDGCDYKKKCALSRSCTPKNGGDTCGAEGALESCCTALPLGSGVKLDKYKVTAGRVRAMVERVGGNVRAWYDANRASLSPDAQAQIDPVVGLLPTGLTGNFSIAEHLGSFIFIKNRPSTQQGCYVQGNGTHTYWLPDAVNQAYGDSPQGFPQDVLDTKPINCIPMPMAMAFCAWDGGRLQTFAENKEMYGPGLYPWGAAPQPGGYNSNGVQSGPGNVGFAQTPCPTCDVAIANWSNNFNPGANPAKPFDYSYFISVPGRFARDKGPFGHLDAGGLMIEHTSSLSANTDTTGIGPNNEALPPSPQYKWGKQGSWEGHGIGLEGYEFAPMTKYGKTSVRCARN